MLLLHLLPPSLFQDKPSRGFPAIRSFLLIAHEDYSPSAWTWCCACDPGWENRLVWNTSPPLAPVASGVLLAWASPAVDWAYLPPQPCLGAGVSVSGFPGLVGGPTGRPLLLLPVPHLLPPTPAPSGFLWLGLRRGLLPVSHQPGPLFCPLPPSPFLLPPLQSGTVSNVSKLGLLPPRFPSPQLSHIQGPRPNFPQDLPPPRSLLPTPLVPGPTFLQLNPARPARCPCCIHAVLPALCVSGP